MCIWIWSTVLLQAVLEEIAVFKRAGLAEAGPFRIRLLLLQLPSCIPQLDSRLSDVKMTDLPAIMLAFE